MPLTKTADRYRGRARSKQKTIDRMPTPPTPTAAGEWLADPAQRHRSHPRLAKGPTMSSEQELSTPPAFTIGPTAAEDKPKADCRIHKGSEQRSTALPRSPLQFTRRGRKFRYSAYA